MGVWLEAWTLAARPGVTGARRRVGAAVDRDLGSAIRSGVSQAIACGNIEEAVTPSTQCNGLAVQVVTGSGGVTRKQALRACRVAAERQLGGARHRSRE